MKLSLMDTPAFQSNVMIAKCSQCEISQATFSWKTIIMRFAL